MNTKAHIIIFSKGYLRSKIQPNSHSKCTANFCLPSCSCGEYPPIFAGYKAIPTDFPDTAQWLPVPLPVSVLEAPAPRRKFTWTQQVALVSDKFTWTVCDKE